MSIPILWPLSLSLLLTSPSAGDQTTKELAILQGKWVLIETANEIRTDRGDERIQMSIAGNDITMKFAGTITNKGTFEIGFLENATVIDMTFANGKAVLGVYELTGDVLILCVAEADQGRPGSLAPKGAQWIEKWRRAKS